MMPRRCRGKGYQVRPLPISRFASVVIASLMFASPVVRGEVAAPMTVQLPAAVDYTKVAAMCQDGVLTVRMPKAEPTVRSRVQIT